MVKHMGSPADVGDISSTVAISELGYLIQVAVRSHPLFFQVDVEQCPPTIDCRLDHIQRLIRAQNYENIHFKLSVGKLLTHQVANSVSTSAALINCQVRGLQVGCPGH